MSRAWGREPATWDRDRPHADGHEETLTARAVISAVGQLNRPNLPDIPGLDELRRLLVPLRPAGTTRSTTRGKRVALIGAGASGFQIVPDDRRRRRSS